MRKVLEVMAFLTPVRVVSMMSNLTFIEFSVRLMAPRIGDTAEASSSSASLWACSGLVEPGELALAGSVGGSSSISEGDSRDFWVCFFGLTHSLRFYKQISPSKGVKRSGKYLYQIGAGVEWDTKIHRDNSDCTGPPRAHNWPNPSPPPPIYQLHKQNVWT